MKNKKRTLATFLSLLAVFILIVVVYGKERGQNLPRDVVYKFLTANSKEESLQYVYKENINIDKKIENNITLLSKELKKNKFNYVMEQDLNLDEIKNGDYTRVKVYKNSESGIYEDKINIFYLIKINDEFKIDFNSVYNNNSKTLDEFIIDEDLEQMVIKVYAKLDNYNNFSIFNINKKIENGDSLSENEKKNKLIPKENLEKIDGLLSLTLKDPDSGIEIQGFLEKNNEETDKYISYLGGAGLKQIVVEISKIDVNNINKVVKINSIKSLDWGYDF